MQPKIWDSYLGRVVSGSLALFLLLPMFVGLLWKCLGWKFPDGCSLGVYIGTGIAVLWYTVETYYLRRETVQQNEIATQPLILINLEAGKLVMANVGLGTALFIRVQPIILTDPAGDNVKFTAKFGGL